MNFKTTLNRISVGGRAVAAKRWMIGWTADQAAQAANRRAGDNDAATPGAYGLLVGAGLPVGGSRR